jgi:hypothetical protein
VLATLGASWIAIFGLAGLTRYATARPTTGSNAPTVNAPPLADAGVARVRSSGVPVVLHPLVDAGARTVTPTARRALEKEAVRHLLSGRLPEAAVTYRALAAAAPGERVHAVIAETIERQLAPDPPRVARDEPRKSPP